MVIHEAARPFGNVQACLRCGIVLLDRRNEDAMEVFANDYFAVGACVERGENFVCVVNGVEPTCRPRLQPLVVPLWRQGR